MSRKKLIAGNHKMNTSLQEGMQLAKAIHNTLKEQAGHVDVLLIPPFTHLFAVSGILKNTPFLTGAQNCAGEKNGAYTGEISADMLASVGATYVLVGHSERRQLFGENGEVLSKKIASALSAGLQIIYCFGETLDERESEIHIQTITSQLEALKNISAKNWESITLAYEPVWAIGTGKTASTQQAQEIHAFTRNWVNMQISEDISQTVRILYGGSVKPDNAAELLSQPDIDGALVGGASLDPNSFSAIVQAAIS